VCVSASRPFSFFSYSFEEHHTPLKKKKEKENVLVSIQIFKNFQKFLISNKQRENFIRMSRVLFKRQLSALPEVRRLRFWRNSVNRRWRLAANISPPLGL
jgi:hypothetical protein